jgi:L-asparaginase II
MRVTEGRLFVKVGAEGVYCAGVPGAELGIAIKVDDGARRAVEPILLGTLKELGVLSDDEFGALAAWAEPDVLNTTGQVVGRVRAVVDLVPGD